MSAVTVILAMVPAGEALVVRSLRPDRATHRSQSRVICLLGRVAVRDALLTPQGFGYAALDSKLPSWPALVDDQFHGDTQRGIGRDGTAVTGG